MPISQKLAYTSELTNSSLHQQAGFYFVTFIAGLKVLRMVICTAIQARRQRFFCPIGVLS